MKFFIGIDPGLHGGIAVIGEDETPVQILPMPVVEIKGKNVLDLPKIRDILTRWKNDSVLIEKQQVMPAQGSVSGFTIGYGYGALVGLLVALKQPYEVIAAPVWKRALGIPVGKATADRKGVAIAKVRALFPHVCLLASPRCKVYHDGMAEALLLAELCRRRHGGIVE